MPPFLSKRGISASQLAVVVTIPAAALAVACGIRWVASRGVAKKSDNDDFCVLPVGKWTATHVGQWLRSLGVSDATVAAFANNDIDGSVLLLIEESHLSTLAPKLRDILLVREGLRNLRTPQKPSNQPRGESEENLRHVPVEGETVEKDFEEAFLRGVGAIETVLSSPDFARAPAAAQGELRAACAEQLRRMQPLLAALPIPLQEKLRPHMQWTNALIASGGSSASATAVSGGDLESKTRKASELEGTEERCDKESNPLKEQLSRLHSMVDDFLRLLEATEGHVVADPELTSLRQHIAGQIKAVMTVASRLPSSLGDPLLQKCALVLRRVSDADAGNSDRVNEPLPPPPPSPPRRCATTGKDAAGVGTAEKTLEVTAVVQRLRGIFGSLKSSDVVSMAPAPRLARIGALIKEVRGLEREANAWADRRAGAVVGEVAKNVISVLQQMEALTREEISEPRRPSVGGAREETDCGNDDDDDVDNVSALPDIVASLQAVLRVVHSDELAAAPPEVQSQIVAEISQRLQEVRRRVQRLPLSEATATVAEMTDRAIAIVRSLSGGDHAGKVDDGNREKHDARPVIGGTGEEETEEEEEHRSDARLGVVNPLQRVQQQSALEQAIVQLEGIFEVVNSDSFSSLAPAERVALAQEQLGRLTILEKRIAQCGGDEELRELVRPLREILQLEAATAKTPTSHSHNHHQRQRQQQQQQQRQHESGRSSVDSATSVVAQLEAVVTFVQSPNFTSADAVTRQHIARELVSRLDAIEARCEEMGEPVAPLLTIALRLRAQLQVIAEPVNRNPASNARENAPGSENVSVNASSVPSANRNADATIDGDDDASAAGRAWNAADDPVAALVATIEELREQLRRVDAPSDLIPIMAAVDRTLSEADTRGVDWREDERAVRVIGAALDEIQLAQRRISRQPSELQRVLLDAARGLQESPPETPAQLRPYAELLVRVREQLGAIPDDARDAFVALHRAVLNATENLRRQAEIATGNDGRNSNGTTMNQARASGAGDDHHRNGNSRIAEVLLEVSDQLREGNVPDEILDQYAQLLDDIDAVGGDPARADAIQSIREQIRLQRLLNGHDVASDDANEEEEKEEEEKEKDDEEDEKETLMEHRIDEAADSEEADEGMDETQTEGMTWGEKDDGSKIDYTKGDILGAESSELLLLPRIESRIVLTPGEFSVRTTPFDMHSMSATLLRLTQSPRVLASQPLLERVARVKAALAQHHSDIDGSHPHSPSASGALQLQTAHTRGSIVLTLRTAAESKGSTPPTKSQKFSRTEIPQPNDVAAWSGRSVAVIVCAPMDAVATAPAELTGLRTLLAERYGFEVVAIPAESAQQLSRVLLEAAAGGVTRLLVYCNAIANTAVSGNEERAMRFTDGSLLLSGELMKSTAGIERVLLAHCGALQMFLLPARRGAVGPTMELNVTDAAFAAVRGRRCWLYNGLFTPALAELLSLDTQTSLSPADLILGAAETIAGTQLPINDTVNNTAANMTFFLPLDQA